MVEGGYDSLTSTRYSGGGTWYLAQKLRSYQYSNEQYPVPHFYQNGSYHLKKFNLSSNAFHKIVDCSIL